MPSSRTPRSKNNLRSRLVPDDIDQTIHERLDRTVLRDIEALRESNSIPNVVKRDTAVQAKVLSYTHMSAASVILTLIIRTCPQLDISVANSTTKLLRIHNWLAPLVLGAWRGGEFKVVRRLKVLRPIGPTPRPKRSCTPSYPVSVGTSSSRESTPETGTKVRATAEDYNEQILSMRMEVESTPDHPMASCTTQNGMETQRQSTASEVYTLRDTKSPFQPNSDGAEDTQNDVVHDIRAKFMKIYGYQHRNSHYLSEDEDNQDFSSALSDRDRVDTPHPAQGSPLQTVTQENRVGSTSMPTRQQLKELRDAMMELMDAMKTFVEKIDEVTENY